MPMSDHEQEPEQDEEQDQQAPSSHGWDCSGNHHRSHSHSRSRSPLPNGDMESDENPEEAEAPRGHRSRSRQPQMTQQPLSQVLTQRPRGSQAIQSEVSRHFPQVGPCHTSQENNTSQRVLNSAVPLLWIVCWPLRGFLSSSRAGTASSLGLMSSDFKRWVVLCRWCRGLGWARPGRSNPSKLRTS